jgi:hypothetical protein
MGIEKHGEMKSSGETPRPPHPSGSPTAETYSSEPGRSGRRKRILYTKYLFHTTWGILTFRKVLCHGADGFTFRLKEGVLGIFSPLKIHRLTAKVTQSQIKWKHKRE